MTKDVGLLPLAFVACLVAVWGGGARIEAAEAPLSLERRLNYQEKIEKVYYAHRAGTLRQSSGQAPRPFEETLPAEALEAKVLKYLRQNAVVDDWHARGRGYALTEEALQRELERICRSTKDPATLRELFAALDNNAFLVKEILVRPILAEKMTRVLYRGDAEFHRPEREKAEAIHEEIRNLPAWAGWEAAAKAHGAQHSKIKLVGQAPTPAEEGGQTGASVPPGHGKSIEVEAEVLSRRYEELKDAGENGILKETEEGFVIERLVGQAPRPSGQASPVTVGQVPSPVMEERGQTGASVPLGIQELEVESIFLPRRPYEEWLEEQITDDGYRMMDKEKTSSSSSVINHSSSDIKFEPLPPIGPGLATCTPETWVWMPPPEPRSYHTAVWTGTEMIVWGGWGGYILGTGGRYNPSTDSWTVTSLMNAPSARYGHIAVWTATEMIVWGGVSDFYLNTGARYNPTTDLWDATSTTGAPSNRDNHTAVWTGTEMIIWGGEIATCCSAYLNTGGRYNPSTNSWVGITTTNAPAARAYHTAIWTGTEMIVWGGYNGGYLNTGGRYSPSMNGWSATTTTSAPSARAYHTAVWTGTEMIVWGGSNENEYGPIYFNTGGRYDFAMDV